jgi:hypothetical protein
LHFDVLHGDISCCLVHSIFLFSFTPNVVVERKSDTMALNRTRRRRLADIVNLGAFAVLLFLAGVVGIMVYGTRTEDEQLSPFIRELLPAGRCLCDSSPSFACDSCLECARNQSVEYVTEAKQEAAWRFRYTRDAYNYGLDEKQCKVAFPGLFEDLYRARALRERKTITEEELSSIKLSKGMVRVMIYKREVCLMAEPRDLLAVHFTGLTVRIYSSTSSKPISWTPSTAKKPLQLCTPFTGLS